MLLSTRSFPLQQVSLMVIVTLMDSHNIKHIGRELGRFVSLGQGNCLWPDLQAGAWKHQNDPFDQLIG